MALTTTSLKTLHFSEIFEELTKDSWLEEYKDVELLQVHIDDDESDPINRLGN